MKTNFVEELRWRGMLQDIMPGTEELLKKEMVTGYIGFDPTADSMGVGNLVQIMTLLHFQRAGHKPIALIGGATGMVGDPSGKSQERNLLDEKTLNHNLSCQKKQLEKFLDFSAGPNSAEIVNNYDWFRSFSFLDFIRDVGKHITVSYMMAKDSVQNRLETGMSFTEFSYQLVQGYDFYWLWKNKNVKLQMGGSDQWGNIVTGTELIRRKDGGEAFALTTPLIKKADGTKFGKTESGNVWLDPKKTSPYDFYQFWLNASDADASTYIRIFSIKNKEEIEVIEAEHKKAPNLRLLQKELAKEITVRVHSQSEYESIAEGSSSMFSLKNMDDFNALCSKGNFHDSIGKLGFPVFNISNQAINNGINILDLLVSAAPVFNSKGEARRLIQGGGLKLNFEKIMDPNMTIDSSFRSVNSYMIVHKGKKEIYLINII